jgi:hypothetical protein
MAFVRAFDPKARAKALPPTAEGGSPQKRDPPRILSVGVGPGRTGIWATDPWLLAARSKLQGTPDGGLFRIEEATLENVNRRWILESMERHAMMNDGLGTWSVNGSVESRGQVQISASGLGQKLPIEADSGSCLHLNQSIPLHRYFLGTQDPAMETMVPRPLH